jgi:hypothetical protein
MSHHTRGSSSSEPTVNWGAFIGDVGANQFLQDESTDTSLQPGEEYPTTPHPYMIGASKQRSATMNQIVILLGTKPAHVPEANRAKFTVLRDNAISNWLYPFTVENPCGTQYYDHWRVQFDTAIIQIVSAQFKLERRITNKGKDLYTQGAAPFMREGETHSVTAKGLQICQPLVYCWTICTAVPMQLYATCGNSASPTGQT